MTDWQTNIVKIKGSNEIYVTYLFLATDPEILGSIPGLPDFLGSSLSGTGSTLPRECNGGATWKKKVAALVYKIEITAVGIHCVYHATPSIFKTLTLNSPTSSGLSAGIRVVIRSRTKATEFVVFVVTFLYHEYWIMLVWLRVFNQETRSYDCQKQLSISKELKDIIETTHS
jgi:hypothetical protein